MLGLIWELLAHVNLFYSNRSNCDLVGYEYVSYLSNPCELDLTQIT